MDELFSISATTDDAIAANYKAKEHIWNHTQKTITKDTVHAMLLQLISLDIVEYQVHVKNDDISNMRNIILKVNWSQKKSEDNFVAIKTYININQFA